MITAEKLTEGKENKQKALMAALQQIEKQFGKGSIMKMDERTTEKIPVVSTGSLSLDIALGVGGLPKGRVIEIYGPESSGKTTLALQVVASIQKEGGTAAYIDAEHALDPVYASKLKVNVGDMLVSQPDNGEQALEIVDMLVRSGSVDLVVVDSVAALVPRAEIEGEMGDSHMGLQARLMSQALRKLTANISRTNTTVIFINQIRMKIGVMFGCFHYNTLIALADGTSEKIGKLVNQEKDVEVLSFNGNTWEIEPAKITKHFNNGKADEFLQFEVDGGCSGKYKFGVTKNHTIFTPEGETLAGELKVGDIVLTSSKDYSLNDEQKQMVIGAMLSGGNIHQAGTSTASFRSSHGKKQEKYIKFKHKMMMPLSQTMQERNDILFFDTKSTNSLSEIKSHFYHDNKKTVTKEICDQITPKALAVWYMDSGKFAKLNNGKSSINAKSMDPSSAKLLINRIKDFGIEVNYIEKKGFFFDSENTKKFQQLISAFIHPIMDYKIHPNFRNKFNWEILSNKLSEISSFKVIPNKILNIYKKPPTRSMIKFDLEIAGNHSYLVGGKNGGVIVHNSPETTTGGNALKFYASVRLDIRRTGSIKDGDTIIGNETKVKVVKNKVAPPFKEAFFDIRFGEGVDKYSELIELAVNNKLIEKSGAWYAYEGAKIGQGKENVRKYMIENPEMSDIVEGKVRALAFAVKVEGEELTEIKSGKPAKEAKEGK